MLIGNKSYYYPNSLQKSLILVVYDGQTIWIDKVHTAPKYVKYLRRTCITKTKHVLMFVLNNKEEKKTISTILNTGFEQII